MDFIYKYESVIRLSAFMGGFSLLALWEWSWPKRELTQNKFNRWINNFSLVVLGTIVVRIVIPTAAIGTAYFVEQNHLGVITHFEWPLWVKILITFVLLDLSIYFQHITFHVIPIFWRFHRVHHSDMDCDVSTGIRFHPIEILISVLIKGAVIIMVGAPVLAVIIFEIVLNMMSMFTHSNIYLNNNFEKILRYFIVTPDMHRIHHSVRENETNSNFCFHLSVWDRTFGTYMKDPKSGQENLEIGLDQFREPNWQSLQGLIFMPFSSRIRGYAINYRDTVNTDELNYVKELALQNQEKARLSLELASYIEAIGRHALVSITDLAGKIIEVNDKFCEVSGYSKEELIGKDHSIVNSGTHPKSFFSSMWNTLSNGNVWVSEICNQNIDGSLYWVDSAIVPVKDRDGSVKRYLSIRVDVTDRKKHELELGLAYDELSSANIKLHRLSRIDSLTKLSNRRCFDETLSKEIRRMHRNRDYLTLILCDIDNFKSFNDTYGHLEGDECLKKVAETIQSSFVRPSDLVARYGGEEFAIILPSSAQDSALELSERLRLNIQDLEIEHKLSEPKQIVTISIGVTTLITDKNTTSAMLIGKADRALYMAKEQGRNNIQFVE